MPALQLTPEQAQLREELEGALSAFSAQVAAGASADRATVSGLVDRMAEVGHRLHASLAAAGHAPLHRAAVLRNRGVPPDDRQFYAHPDAAQDLVEFTHNPDVHAEPPDLTLGKDFALAVRTRRWGHPDQYRLTRIKSGWRLAGPPWSSGDCDKGGRPFLFTSLDHDAVDYPANLAEWLDWLWHQAAGGLTEAEVQKGFDTLGHWLQLVETSKPSGGLWQGLTS